MNLNQITVPSLDIVNAIAFYKTLGLQLIVQALPKYARFECPTGDATFSIHVVDALPKGFGVTVYFEVDNLDTTAKDLQRKGLVFTTQSTDQPWLWQEASLKDPDSNHIILYTAGSNRKNPPWRV